MNTIREKLEKILTIQAPIYGGKGGKGIHAVDQLLALFREEWGNAYTEGHRDANKVLGIKIPDNVRIAKLSKLRKKLNE